MMDEKLATVPADPVATPTLTLGERWAKLVKLESTWVAAAGGGLVALAQALPADLLSAFYMDTAYAKYIAIVLWFVSWCAARVNLPKADGKQ